MEKEKRLAIKELTEIIFTEKTLRSGIKRNAASRQILVKFLSFKDEHHADKKKQKCCLQRKKQ